MCQIGPALREEFFKRFLGKLCQLCLIEGDVYVFLENTQEATHIAQKAGRQTMAFASATLAFVALPCDEGSLVETSAAMSSGQLSRELAQT